MNQNSRHSIMNTINIMQIQLWSRGKKREINVMASTYKTENQHRKQKKKELNTKKPSMGIFVFNISYPRQNS